ncbi:MAG TPA: diacylglycerol kinase family protein [Ilumatobacter sp.]|nr:diacylglycerol kinase family protein [Ilumatobacter sp.]
MNTLHVVEGAGGSARAVDRAAAAVVEQARANGWVPTVIGLADIDARLGEIERLVLCGGDGLVHRAVQHVAGTGVDVAVVPVGSGNDFVRAFGITAATATALATAAPGTATVRAVDLIETCPALGDELPVHRYAASVLTAGYSGRVNETANRMRFPPGSAKYTVAAVREIGRLTPRLVNLTMQLPDGPAVAIEEPLTLVAIGNTAWFGGGMEICAGAEPSDGLLQVVVVGPLSRRAFLRWLPRSFKGTHGEHPAVTTIAATEVTIDTRESLWADGEPFAAAPVTVRAAPGALRLCVPSG